MTRLSPARYFGFLGLCAVLILAVIVVFFFLRDWRATIIAAIAIPLAAVPTFWFMDMMGFSLNMLSLLALSLVAGVLVDDAIVDGFSPAVRMNVAHPSVTDISSRHRIQLDDFVNPVDDLQAGEPRSRQADLQVRGLQAVHPATVYPDTV